MPRDDQTRAAMGLPVRPFLYTLDQIATLISLTDASLARHLHYDGRSVGPRHPDRLLARNLAATGDKPEWRVAEHELIRWVRRKGFRVYERGWVNI